MGCAGHGPESACRDAVVLDSADRGPGIALRLDVALLPPIVYIWGYIST